MIGRAVWMSIGSTLVMLAVTACHRAPAEGRAWVPRSALRRELVGCLALRDARGRAADSGYYGASPRVWLDTVPIGSIDPLAGAAWLLRRLDAEGRPLDQAVPHPLFSPRWTADSLTDSVRLSFHDGFSGAVFILAAPAGADTLRGRAVEYWDVGPSKTNRGRVWALRIRCDHPDSSPAAYRVVAADGAAPPLSGLPAPSGRAAP